MLTPLQAFDICLVILITAGLAVGYLSQYRKSPYCKEIFIAGFTVSVTCTFIMFFMGIVFDGATVTFPTLLY